MLTEAATVMRRSKLENDWKALPVMGQWPVCADRHSLFDGISLNITLPKRHVVVLAPLFALSNALPLLGYVFCLYFANASWMVTASLRFVIYDIRHSINVDITVVLIALLLSLLPTEG